VGIKKEFLKDTIIYGLGRGIKKFIGLFLLPFYTRALTPEDFGILGILSTGVLLITAFLNLGLDSAAGFYFFQAKTEIEKGKVLFTLFVIRLLTIIPCLLLSFFSETISFHLFSSSDYTWIVFITFLIIPISLLMSEQTHVHRYYREPWKFNIATIIKSLSNIGIGIYLVILLKIGVLGAQTASFISSLLVVIYSYFFFTRKKYSYKFSPYWAKKMLKFGFPLIWASISVWIFQSSDKFILLYFKDLAEIGYYTIGSTFSQPILLINSAVQMSFGVLFFSIFNKEQDQSKPESKKAAIEVLNIYLIFAISISLFLSIFSLELVNFITTPDYILGCLAIPFLTFSYIAAQSIQLTGVGISIGQKMWHVTWIVVSASALNLILNFILIPHYGFIGAACATLCAYAIYWLLHLTVSQHFFKIPYKLISIFFYFFLAFLLSALIPILQLKFGVSTHFLVKIGLFSLGVLLPFIFGIISLQEIWRGTQSIINRIK